MALPVRVLGISGSLRKKSFNTMALNAAVALAPPEMTIETAEIGDLPLYNQDVYDAGAPPAVQRFRAQCAAAEAILFVTPEYNFSIPGGLKNAIDWGSRAPNPPLMGKPCAIMGAATGILGTARAQYHLRQMCVFLDMKPINKPEVFIGQAATKFAADGTLTDETAKTLIGDLLKALQAWTVKLRG